MIGMNPKDTIKLDIIKLKLDIIKLDKSETLPKESVTRGWYIQLSIPAW